MMRGGEEPVNKAFVCLFCPQDIIMNTARSSKMRMSFNNLCIVNCNISVATATTTNDKRDDLVSAFELILVSF